VFSVIKLSHIKLFHVALKVNMTFAVPPIIMFLNKHPMAAKADLSSLKRVVSGAAPLGAEMVQEFYNKHPQCAVGQGLQSMSV